MTELVERLGSARDRLKAATPPRPTLDGRPFYTVTGLAEKLALSERTIRTYLDRGDIAWYRIGPQRRIDPADVDRWLEARRQTG